MSKKKLITWSEFFDRLDCLDKKGFKYYGVPRGGMIVTAFLKRGTVVETPEKADIIIDDIVDSGHTKNKFNKLFPTKDFVAIVDKQDDYLDRTLLGDYWIVFPWQKEKEDDIETNFIRILQWYGQEVNDENIKTIKKYFDEQYTIKS